MKKLIFIIFLLLPFWEAGWGVLFAQSDDSLYYTNPDYHVAKELFNKKIVMLGDYVYHQPGPYKHIHDVLNNWLQICETKTEVIKLTYIIEYEDVIAVELNKYFKTGDIKPVVGKLEPEFYLIDLEYFAQLKNIYKKVDSLNINRTNKISFTIKGFEDSEKLSIKSRLESELWFIYERDSSTAMRIIDYLNANTDEQVLFFYGGKQVLDGFIIKSFDFDDLTQKESMSYSLAHYLKKEFGDENVETFYKSSFDKNINNPELELLKGKDFITKPINLKNERIHDTVDYIYSSHTHFFQQSQGSYINSKFIIKNIIKNLKRAKDRLPGYKATIYYNSYLSTLNNILGTNFKDDSGLFEWLSKYPYDGCDSLYSNRITDKFSDQFVHSHNKDYINSIISQYGIAYTIIDSDIINFDKWKENELPEILKHIKFTNSIGIYWFGYPDEQIKAKEYLKEFSGVDYAEPEKYMQWYRKNFYTVDY